MLKIDTLPLELASNADGFSIVQVAELYSLAQRLIISDISKRLGIFFKDLDECAEFIVRNEFDNFKDKAARLLSKSSSKIFLEALYPAGFLRSAYVDFVTDEEQLGYENFYWRLVRKGKSQDVGPLHADKWFWDLGHGKFPATHSRVKVWMPLIQDNNDPGLVILPGSHVVRYLYSSYVDSNGKRKPVLSDTDLSERMVKAPVRTGEAIVFNDCLLHGGRATRANRVSIEWTIGASMNLV